MNSEPRYRNCALCLVNKNCLVRTACRGTNGAQLASIWGQNHVLEGLWRCLWDQKPGLMWPKWSQARFPQFRPSILGSFWTQFWKTFKTKASSTNEVPFTCVLGIGFSLKFDGISCLLRTKWRCDLSISSEMCKVYFWTTVHVFWRFLLFSTTLGSRELEAKINFETQLEKDINPALIFSWFWSQKSSEIGSKID